MRRNARSETNRGDKSLNAEIVIVGGGPAGLCMAAALGAENIPVICLERTPEVARRNPRPDGRTVALSYRSVQLLKQAGVWTLIAKDACPIHFIRVADQSSNAHLDFDHAEVGDNPFGWIIETHLFQAALYKHVKSQKSVRLIFGTEITATERSAEQVQITLADGQGITAQLMIAADGRHSQSRKHAGVIDYGWDYHQTAIVCLLKHSMPHNNIAVEHFQPGGPFATLPMTGQRTSIVWTEKTAAAKALMNMSVEDFAATLQDKVEDYLGEIEVIGDRFAFPLSLQHAGTYIGHRLALIGDAAHGIHPIAGQGFNLGMGDIEVLRDALFAAFDLGQTAGDASILKAYEKRRKFENGQMVVMTDLLVWLFSNSIPGVQGLRRAGLGIVQQIPPLRRFFMRRAMGIKRAA